MIGWKQSSEPDDWATFVSGENPTTRRVLPLVNCFAAVMLAVPRHSSGSLPGCRRFLQDAKLNVDALFQNALSHKEHESRFSCARGAIHSDGHLGVREVGLRRMVNYEQTV